MKCPKCGSKMSFFDRHCSKCGCDNSSLKVVMAVVIVIVIIAIGGIFASGILSHDNSNDVSVVNNTDSQDNVQSADDNSTTQKVDEQSSTADDSSQEYWASSKTDKFHLPTCEWAQKIKDSNKIVFDSREEAVASGREPCSVCNP